MALTFRLPDQKKQETQENLLSRVFKHLFMYVDVYKLCIFKVAHHIDFLNKLNWFNNFIWQMELPFADFITMFKNV